MPPYTPPPIGVPKVVVSSFTVDPASFWGDHGSNGMTFSDIAVYTALTTNALADFAGVQMSAPPLPPGAVTRDGASSSGLELLYTQDDHDFMVNESGQRVFVCSD